MQLFLLKNLIKEHFFNSANRFKYTMKKFVASLLFLTLLSANMSAQMLGLLKDSVHGPVKQVTAITYTTNEPNVKWKDVAYYDRDGRQTEYYEYECNTLIWKCIYYH